MAQNGELLAHTTLGAGPPVIVLHGLLGSARNWAPVVKRLSENFRVHALDLRNHGDSFWGDEVGYAAMAEDVGHYMRMREIEGAAVIGHSMGGKVAMTLALADDQPAVGPLVVADIAPVAYTPGFLKLLKAMRAIDPSAFERRGQVDALLSAEVPDPRLRGFLMSNMASGDDGYYWKINLDALIAGHQAIAGPPDHEPGAAHDGETLFLSGGESDYVRDEHHEKIRQLFPRAEMQVVPDAGHWLHAEKPDAVITALETFLG